MGWQKVELFSMPVLDRAKYHCQVASWWVQYEVHILIFEPTPLISVYYSELVLPDSADDQTRVWTVALT